MDDEFDDSYDGLLRLGVLLGEVKGRGTPQEIVDALPTATYKEWSNAQDCETRCPICLDDVRLLHSLIRGSDSDADICL
jgi:hypothetical protein